MEPGKQMAFESHMFVPNAMAEFKDLKLGILYGQGSGHAFIRVSALKEVVGRSGLLADFPSLAKAFRSAGYSTKEIKYLRVT